MGWLWAAYKKGLWTDMLPENASKDNFEDCVVDILSKVDLDWIFEVHTQDGMRPVGIVGADFRFEGHAIEPHVDWFPWATPRNKIESIVNFLTEIGKQYKIFVYSTAVDLPFWERIHKYKVLVKGCKITDCCGRGEDAMMYYTPGPFV